MMKWVMVIMLTAAVISAAVTGRMAEVSESFLSECNSAVELTISLAGIICLWSGVMQVAQKSGITEKLATLFSPVSRKTVQGAEKRRKGNAVHNP